MRVLYFAWLREKIGLGEEEVALPPDVTTPRQLIAFLGTRDAVHAQAFARVELIRCAVDQAFCPLDAPFGDAVEIGFFPPVTGG